MVDKELLDLVIKKLKENKSREVIDEELIEEGWEHKDINEAVRQVRWDALRQLPAFSPFIKFVEDIETRILHMPVMGSVIILISVLAFLVGTVLYLNFIYDPLGQKGSARDAQREKDINNIHQAIDNYYKDKRLYPLSLDDLVPEYLSTVPHDPQAEKPYDYKIIDDNINYQLCVNFEQNPVQCITSRDSDIQLNEESASVIAPVQEIVPTQTTINIKNASSAAM